MVIVYAYILVSLATFVVYGFDKRQARAGGRGVRERTLHWLELLGGWPGGAAGQVIFHHKRRKLGYMLVFFGIAGLHVMLWALWFRLLRH